MKNKTWALFLILVFIICAGILSAQPEQHTSRLLKNIRSYNQEKIRMGRIKSLVVFRCGKYDDKIIYCSYDKEGKLIDSVGYPTDRLRYLFSRQEAYGKDIDPVYYFNNELISFRFTFSYNAKGLRVSVVEHSAHPTPQGELLKFVDVTRQYSYDENDRLVKVVGTTPAGIMVQQDDYTYDGAGNVTEWHQFRSSFHGNFICRYTYDAQGNLTEYAKVDGNGEFVAKERCTYDLNNLLRKWENISKFGLTQYRKDFSYDNAGNMVECQGYIDGEDFDSKLQLTYDDRGDIVESVFSKGRVALNGDFHFRDVLHEKFIYDDKNNLLRVERTARHADSDQTNDYFYDDDGNIIQKTDGSGECIRYSYEYFDQDE